MPKGEIPQSQIEKGSNLEGKSVNQKENTQEIIFADEGEKVINHQGGRPKIREIFDLARNPDTKKYRAVAVPINKIPTELYQILSFVDEMDYVAQYTDEIIF